MFKTEIKNAKRDIAVSVFFVFLAILAIININSGSTEGVVETKSLTHATLPTIYSILLIILSGVIGISAIIKITYLKKREVDSETQKTSKTPEGMSRTHVLRFFETLVLLILYALLLPLMNFMFLTITFLALQFFIFGQRNLIKIAIASIIGGIFFYVLFIVLLNLPI